MFTDTSYHTNIQKKSEFANSDFLVGQIFSPLYAFAKRLLNLLKLNILRLLLCTALLLTTLLGVLCLLSLLLS